MIGIYALTLATLPSIVTVLFLLGLSVFTWQRRRMPGALPFMFGCLFATLWAAGVVLEYAAVDLPDKILWVKFQAAWQLPVVTAISCFILDYAWPGRWLKRRTLAVVSVPCLIVVGMILTNNSYALMWSGFSFAGSVVPHLALGGWLGVAYGLGVLGALNLFIFVWLFNRSPQHRWPVALMLVGQVVSRMTFIFDVAQIQALAFADLSVVVLFLSWTTYAIAIFGFHILDPLPAARRTVIEQMYTGMVVFDAKWRVVSLNPAAERILGMRRSNARGKTWQQVAPQTPLPKLPDVTQPAGSTAERIEMTFGGGPVTHYYEPVLSPLRDFRDLLMGYLLVLNDVTEQKRAQVKLLEQQRALAASQEREFLAHELHDSVGQVLGFASLKVGAARKLIADGRLEGADDQLAHLENVMADAHADVREYILNLHTALATEKPFFPALRDYLGDFRQNYGIRAEVSIGPGVGEDVFAPDTQTQIFRILQEALSNARKHAAADQVEISFGMQDGKVRMRVQDNGKGFDPRQASGAGNGHFGLLFMRERAESLGGSLQIHSAPGEGTCVEVEVPLCAS